MDLKKEHSTLEPALQRANKSVEKLKKDIADLEDATCYACGQTLHEDKKAEIEDISRILTSKLLHNDQTAELRRMVYPIYPI